MYSSLCALNHGRSLLSASARRNRNVASLKYVLMGSRSWLLLFLALQRYYMQGLLAGSVKG